ncbi:aspartate carbamoyltransferase catalytic subunit [Prochlorococcus marinus XMU1419]|uniref:aspartate carbamoyltransferase catalytic subunit n=1 Tax=Prochlorococcus marinus TaxID=1219 RepID=UPI001ADD0D73|nr:aspartate carbamoyltransferase catalytic subunit [Prochlorococcus marinus]MBO8233136.1 aspartate carbamoyltransferase catalytic subunit [Prochlorococcus marinus XMU1419]MBW3076622.1 aspartate carbamoyltransferase [Prochlorococcus marinus str. XMU1419]
MQIWPHKHIHTLANFSIQDYESVFELADRFDALKNAETKKIPALQGTLVTSLFFEPSTRTKNSFELAAKRLSADVQTFAPSSSSLIKGETIIDTAITYSAMGADTLIIRHSSSYITFDIAKKLDSINSNTSVLNAGDGLHSHPSQGLLDTYTLIKFFSKNTLNSEVLNSKKILIIGDVNHSRVARSNLWALSAFGADIILCGPKTLIPDEFINFFKNPTVPTQLEDPVKSRGSITISRTLEESIKIADAIIVLRLQKERMMENLLSSIDSYSSDYGLTSEKLSLNSREIPILHPGPINRDIEISSEVVDEYPNCLINNQVANGIPIRMALLYLLKKYNK